MDNYTALRIQKSNQNLAKNKNSPVRIIIKTDLHTAYKNDYYFLQREIDLHFFYFYEFSNFYLPSGSRQLMLKGFLSLSASSFLALPMSPRSQASRNSFSFNRRSQPATFSASISSLNSVFPDFSTVNFYVKWISFLCARFEELAFIHGQKRGQENRMKFLNLERENRVFGDLKIGKSRIQSRESV